jgi:WXG100 family type VII secretion target
MLGGLAKVIKVLFDDLGGIAKTFQQNADDIGAVHKEIMAAQDTLQGGDWIGDGAKKFQGEMEESINPSLKGLQRVMEEASQVTHQIGEVMHQAEEDAQNALVIVIGL